MSAAQNRADIDAKLRQAWRHERRFYNLRGASRLFLWLVVMILMDLVVDWGIIFRSRLPQETRFILLAVNVVVLGWVWWHEWLRFFRPFDPVLTALEVERQHPELASTLVSYTQLKVPPRNQPNVSLSLLAAMRDQAMILTRPMDFREVVEFRQLRNLMVVVSFVLLFFTGLSIAKSGHMRSLLLRMSGVDAGYPTATTIVRVTGDLVIQQGAAPCIVATVSGRVPESGELFVKSTGNDGWQAVPIARQVSGNGDRFERWLPVAQADLTYYLKIGDSRTAEHRITVVPPPEILATTVTYKYPAYLNRADASERINELNLEVPEGTGIRWQVQVDVPVRAMDVSFGETNQSAVISRDGRVAEFEWSADHACRYGFRWTEKRHGFQYESVSNSIRVVPDRLPSVEILAPADHGLATLNKRLRLLVDASDDHGLANAWLVYSVDGHNEERFEIAERLGGASHRLDYSLVLKDMIPGLKEGATLQFFVEVSDFHPERTHRAQTATRRLMIVDEEQYLTWFRGELDSQREEIRQAREAEESAESNVRDLKLQEKK